MSFGRPEAVPPASALNALPPRSFARAITRSRDARVGVGPKGDLRSDMKEATPHDPAGRDVGGIAIRLLDDVYTAWHRAQIECHIALRTWLDTGTTNDGAYRAYRAALDREEAAALDLERVSGLAAA
jgi:hypothetical protein